jgi:transposase
MRGENDKQASMFVAFNVDERVHMNHPLRKIKALVDARLEEMNPQFDEAYNKYGRPSIPPESLLKAMLLQALYSIRSERQLVEQIDWNVLYRWFVDMAPDAPVWDATTFTKNRERFEEHGLVQVFFDGVVKEAIRKGLASSDHFSVDGTLVQAHASIKSFKRKDGGGKPPTDGDRGNPTVDFRGEKRGNKTHESKTDPEAKLMRKAFGKEAKLSHGVSILMENRHGLCVGVAVHTPFPSGEAEAAPELVKEARRKHGFRVKTLGADAGYDSGPGLKRLGKLGVVMHVPVDRPKDAGRIGAKARLKAYRRMDSKGYEISMRIRKRIEEVFGWAKTVGGQARTRFVGRWRLRLSFLVTASAYNLLRMARCVT